MIYAMQRRDPEYLKTIRRYPNDREPGKREADYFSHALGALMIALNSDVQDYLGLLYEEHISTGHLSQIFTPQSLGQMISAIALESQESPFTVCDPACGSGRLLIEAVKQGPVKYACGIDLDDRCAKMTALNLLFMNVNAVVVCGNTLTDELRSAFEITHTPSGGLIREAPSAMYPERKIQPYLNRVFAIHPSLWGPVRDKRFFWQAMPEPPPVPDPTPAEPETVEKTPPLAVPLHEIFTPLARIQQRPVETALAETGIRKRRWLKTQQRSVGDYDIEKIDGYTLRITPSFTSAHDAQSYTIRLQSRGYDVTPDPDQTHALLVRKPDRDAGSGLDFG